MQTNDNIFFKFDGKVEAIIIVICLVCQVYYLSDHLYYASNIIQSEIIGVFTFCSALALVLLNCGYRKCAVLIFLISVQGSLTYQVFNAGGLKAPSPYWFAALPIFWGLFYQRKGCVAGLLLNLVTYSLFYIYRDEIIVPPYLLDASDALFAGFKNLVVFTIFMFALVLIYSFIIQKNKRSLKRRMSK